MAYSEFRRADDIRARIANEKRELTEQLVAQAAKHRSSIIGAPATLLRSLEEETTRIKVRDQAVDDMYEQVVRNAKLILSPQCPAYYEQFTYQPVVSFLEELLLVDKLQAQAAEQALLRFANGMRHPQIKLEQRQKGFLRAVADYAMLCLGVIIPDQSGQRKPQPVIVQHRWSVPGSKQLAATGEEVRQFMAGVVSTNAEFLLQTANFAQVHDHIRGAVTLATGGYVGSEAPVIPWRCLLDTFLKEEFERIFLHLCQKSWYPQVQKFWLEHRQTKPDAP